MRAVLTVDDTDLRGEHGDGALSLFEAIALATGRLAPAQLDAKERLRIEGEPGAGRNDVIRFAEGLVVSLRSPGGPVASLLPPLDDDGDAIDGRGARLDARPLEGKPPRGIAESIGLLGGDRALPPVPPLFLVRASHVTISGLRIEALPTTAIRIEGLREPGSIGVAIRDNVIDGASRDLPIDGIAARAESADTASAPSPGRMSGLRIEGNRVSRFANGISLGAGVGSGAGESTSGSALEEASIVGNEVSAVGSGIVIVGGSASGGAIAAQNGARSLTIAGNQIVDAAGTAILISAGSASQEGSTRQNRIEDLTLRGNWIWSGAAGAGRTAIGIAVSAGFVASSAAGGAKGDLVSGLVIERNAVDGPATGLVLAASSCERTGAGASIQDAAITEVAVRDNVWRNVDVGMLLASAQVSDAGASVRASRIERIELDRETILARDTAVIASASSVRARTNDGQIRVVTFAGAEPRSSLSDNRVSELSIRNAWLEGSAGLVLAGGMTSGGNGAIRDSSLERVSISDNTVVPGGAEIVIAGGVAQSTGTVERSSVQVLDMARNRTPRGDSLHPRVAPDMLAAGASTESAQGNRVVGAVVQ